MALTGCSAPRRHEKSTVRTTTYTVVMTSRPSTAQISVVNMEAAVLLQLQHLPPGVDHCFFVAHAPVSDETLVLLIQFAVPTLFSPYHWLLP